MAVLELLSQTTAASQSPSGNSLDNADWIALASAIISVIALLVTVYFSKRAESASRSANSVAAGQAETQLRAAITASSQWIDQCNIEIVNIRKDRKEDELSSDEKVVYGARVANYNNAVQQYLHSYEDACAKYLDNKIDTQRFKQIYAAEIRNLCQKETGTIHRLLHPRAKSNFRAIWAVYEKWNNSEMNPRA